MFGDIDGVFAASFWRLSCCQQFDAGLGSFQRMSEGGAVPRISSYSHTSSDTPTPPPRCHQQENICTQPQQPQPQPWVALPHARSALLCFAQKRESKHSEVTRIFLFPRPFNALSSFVTMGRKEAWAGGVNPSLLQRPGKGAAGCPRGTLSPSARPASAQPQSRLHPRLAAFFPARLAQAFIFRARLPNRPASC